MTDQDLAAHRADYGQTNFDVADLTPDPVELFQRWYDQAVAADLPEPNAMALATTGPDGVPAARMVLLKGVDETGFVFYTNLTSAKGRDLAADPRCALLFPWHPMSRQVRVVGRATLLPRSQVDAYFATRPRDSQLGAWASDQSQVVAARADLDAAWQAVVTRFAGVKVPAPPHWGGFCVRPEVVEFWQGRTGRMHDRLVYRRQAGHWSTERLAP
jgi:pyridoxamine 5'-phosphate oxidase